MNNFFGAANTKHGRMIGYYHNKVLRRCDVLEEIQHFGITVVKPLETPRFYNSALMFPFVSMNVVQGSLFDRIYKLRRVVNFIAWYQFPSAAMELFYMPTLPPGNADTGNILLPGYRYAGYRVEGLDGYIERLESRRLSYRLARHGDTRALLVCDPTGINNILFEQRGGGRSCALGIEEAGLTVADPDAYAEYFRVIGLAQAPERNGAMENIIQELFRLDQPVEMFRFGHIRLLHFPNVRQPQPQKFFPYAGGESGHHFNDAGVQHAAYIVEDAHKFYEEARADGIHFLFEPTRVPGGSLISYFLDPEGNTIEIVQPEPRSAKVMKLLGSVYAEGIALRSRLQGGK
jgi:catechol 2,3-dioxygenase-like lactoylglutathione lyase family enzyme